MNMLIKFGVHNIGELCNCWVTDSFSRRALLHGVIMAAEIIIIIVISNNTTFNGVVTISCDNWQHSLDMLCS